MEIEYLDDESQDNENLDETKGREAFNENGAVYELQDIEEQESDDDETIIKKGAAPRSSNLLHLEDEGDMVIGGGADMDLNKPKNKLSGSGPQKSPTKGITQLF